LLLSPVRRRGALRDRRHLFDAKGSHFLFDLPVPRRKLLALFLYRDTNLSRVGLRFDRIVAGMGPNVIFAAESFEVAFRCDGDGLAVLADIARGEWFEVGELEVLDFLLLKLVATLPANLRLVRGRKRGKVFVRTSIAA